MAYANPFVIIIIANYIEYMSAKVRTDHTCLNCGHTVEKIFCSHCGQKNVEVKENFWQLASHYVLDYFHFDSQLGKSVYPLLFKPGYLPKMYLSGKRASYINPIGALIFLSTLFFILFWSVNMDGIKPKLTTKKLSHQGLYFSRGSDQVEVDDQLPRQIDSFRKTIIAARDSGIVPTVISLSNATLRDKVNERVGALIDNREGQLEQFKERFKHYVPKLLILLIPFLTFFVWLLYLRQRRLYVEHLVFITYNYCFMFLLFSVGLILHQFLPFIPTITFLGTLVYILMGMRYLYGQSWVKTIIKFVSLSIIFLVLMSIGTVLNTLVAIW
jgi:Protein of unknown function (DUF3667)